MVQGQPAIVVCVYDINDLDAARVADVLVVHPNAIVRGKPRSAGHAELPADARERILATAARLFHDTGIRATGVDKLIEQAGVAKATFYRHFPSKDDLVEAWLRDPRTRWFDRIRAQAQSSGSAPREEMLLYFEAVAEWLETDGFRGCPYLNTTVEITDPAHPARVIARESIEEIGAYVRTTVTAAGYADAERLANELHTLLAGAISLAVALETGAPAAAALEAARQLLPESGRQPDAGLAARV
jgi:AcrR family transcriptional regulator